jgi:hypothetical protein
MVTKDSTQHPFGVLGRCGNGEHGTVLVEEWQQSRRTNARQILMR